MLAHDDEVQPHEKHKDGNKRGLRHRIPYSLLGHRSMGTKRLVVSSKVWLPAIPTQNCDVVMTFPANTSDSTLMWLLARLKSRTPSLTVHVRHHSHTGIYGFYLTAHYESLLQGAEELAILKPLKSEYGGGMKEFIFEDQDCFDKVEDEAQFFSSEERQSIVLHFLNELRATSDDILDKIHFVEGQPVVPLLITKNVIAQVFPLHNSLDLKELQQNWVQAIFSPQPLDLTCRYFGVKIALYFAYLGHYTTWLIWPALAGLFVFLLQGTNQFLEDVCFVCFAFFNVIWALLYLKFWKRASTVLSYTWGTLKKTDELLKDPRPIFTGSLAKSPVTGHLELVYPAWKRSLFCYFITWPLIALGLSLVFMVMFLCFELQEWVNEMIASAELPYIFSFGPKVLLAVVISMLDEIYKQLAIWLTHKENYRLEETHETHLVIKLVLFQFVNSFLSLFYIGFYLRDMDRLRDQLAALLITRQVLGNIKETLFPYIIWKARLYHVGYRIATRMSPASVEKHVRKMTSQPRRHRQSIKKKEELQAQDATKGSDGESSTMTEEEDEGVPHLTQAEVESAMKKYEDTLDDYLEMCIQFGYITLFSPAFPLAALCALVNNIIEIRSDAFKLCLTHQRPFGKRVENIGIWQDVLLMTSILAIIVNCVLLGTSGTLTRLAPNWSTTASILIIVLIEHIILAMKFTLSKAIPDMPQDISTKMAKLEFLRQDALKLLESQAIPHQSGVNTAHISTASPHMHRRRLADSSTDSSAQHPSMLPTSTANPASSTPSPTVITPVAPRPSNIPVIADLPQSLSTSHMGEMQKPVPPIRTSLLKAEAKNTSISQEKPAYTDKIADKMVEAAVHPSFEHVDNPKASQAMRSLDLTLSSVPSRLHTKPALPSAKRVETFRRYYRKSNLAERRGLSDPVEYEVSAALQLHEEKKKQSENGDSKSSDHSPEKARERKVVEGRSNLRESRMEQLRRSQENIAKREALSKNPNLKQALDATERKGSPSKTRQKPPPFLHSSSEARISTDPTLSVPSQSVTSRLSVSPRLLRNKIRTDVANLANRVLSRKSRSFSTADVSDEKQTWRERFAWNHPSPDLRRRPSDQRGAASHQLVPPPSTGRKDLKGKETEASKPTLTRSRSSEHGSHTSESSAQKLQGLDPKGSASLVKPDSSQDKKRSNDQKLQGLDPMGSASLVKPDSSQDRKRSNDQKLQGLDPKDSASLVKPDSSQDKKRSNGKGLSHHADANVSKPSSPDKK